MVQPVTEPWKPMVRVFSPEPTFAVGPKLSDARGLDLPELLDDRAEPGVSGGVDFGPAFGLGVLRFLLSPRTVWELLKAENRVSFANLGFKTKLAERTAKKRTASITPRAKMTVAREVAAHAGATVVGQVADQSDAILKLFEQCANDCLRIERMNLSAADKQAATKVLLRLRTEGLALLKGTGGAVEKEQPRRRATANRTTANKYGDFDDEH